MLVRAGVRARHAGVSRGPQDSLKTRTPLFRAAHACSRAALAYATALQAPRCVAMLFQHSLSNVYTSGGLDSSDSRSRRGGLLRGTRDDLPAD
eukprot:5281513-Alexandrium_andersonii.AAC.1